MNALVLALFLAYPPPSGQETPAQAPALQWPGFRGLGSGHTQAKDLPTEWSKPVWSQRVAGYGQSSPTIWKERVFITSIEGPMKELGFVSCLRLSDGLMLWSRSFELSSQTENSEAVSRGAPTPTLDKERVYAFFESGDLISLDHNGREAWKVDLYSKFGPFKGNHGISSSPLVMDKRGFVLLDHDGPSHLLAFDVATGNELWVVEREPRVSWSTPIASAIDENELIVSSNGFVEGFGVADGALRWRVEGISGNTIPSPTAFGNHVLIGRSRGEGLSLVEIAEGGTSKLVWSGNDLPPSGFASPLVLGNSALLLNRAGILSAVALKTGELQWEKRLACGGAWASPITDGQNVWFFGKDGITSVIRLDAEGLSEIAVNEVESEGGIQGVAAVNASFIVREPNRVSCFRKTPAND